jgi:hypothetical protein
VEIDLRQGRYDLRIADRHISDHHARAARATPLCPGSLMRGTEGGAVWPGGESTERTVATRTMGAAADGGTDSVAARWEARGAAVCRKVRIG